MRKLWHVSLLVMLAALIAACGGNPTPAIPTADPNAGTPEASITPNPELAEESTDEATAEMTAEGTEAALNTAFNIQVSGETELEFNSDDGASVEETFSDAGVGGQSTLNTPGQTLQIFQFTTPDQATFFELTISAAVVEGTYEIGIDNVGTTVGNNINEDAAGSSAGAGAEATSEATDEADMTAEADDSAQATQDGSAPTEAPNEALNSNNAPSAGADQGGVVERDESLPPTIAARLESVDGDGISYNLLTGGTLTIDARTENRISGSFEFTLSPADDESATVTVTGTFTDLSLVPEDAFLTPAP